MKIGEIYQFWKLRKSADRLLRALLLAVGMTLGLTAWVLAAGPATLTITPDKTEVTSDGSAVEVTYTISVAPPKGEEIGVFSFRLQPPEGMSLPTQFKVDGQRVIEYADNGLPYSVLTESGVFRTYEYTPGSCYFAAVGSSEDNRMKDAAQILAIKATIQAGRAGTFRLDADFLAARDGSGEVYPVKVDTPPVTVTVPGQVADNKSAGSSDTSETPSPGSDPDTTQEQVNSGEITGGQQGDAAPSPDGAAQPPTDTPNSSTGAPQGTPQDTPHQSSGAGKTAAIVLAVLAAAAMVWRLTNRHGRSVN